jgi:hypothetical protein
MLHLVEERRLHPLAWARLEDRGTVGIHSHLRPCRIQPEPVILKSEGAVAGSEENVGAARREQDREDGARDSLVDGGWFRGDVEMEWL